MKISIYEVSMDRHRYLTLVKDYQIDIVHTVFDDIDERARLEYNGPNDWAEYIYTEIIDSIKDLEQEYVDEFILYTHNEMVPVWEMLKSIIKKRNKEYQNG